MFKKVFFQIDLIMINYYFIKEILLLKLIVEKNQKMIIIK